MRNKFLTTTSFYLLICLMPYFMGAQTIQLSDAISRSYFPDILPQLQWQPNGEYFSYIDLTSRTLVRANAKGKEEKLISLNGLNQKLGSNMDRFPPFSWADDNSFIFGHSGKLLRYNLETDIVETLTVFDEKGSLTEMGRQGTHAYVRDHNLYVQANDSLEQRKITGNGSRNLTYGEAAHRFEFGIQKGLFWSPNSRKLAFYKVDRSMVSDYPFVDYSQSPAQAKPVKYPMSGQASHHASIGVYDLDAQETVYLDIQGPKDQYLTNITWSPDGNYLYVAVVNRDQNQMKLHRYDAQNGKLDLILFEENQSKYVEPEHGPIFFPDNPELFLWFSERDGFDHLYLYNTEGMGQKQLTKGQWKVTDFLGFGPDAKFIYISATAEGAMERHSYAVSVKDGSMIKLSSQEGWHRSQLSPNGKYLLDTWSSLDMPYQAQVISTKNGQALRTIYTSSDPLADLNIGSTRLLTLKSDDGVDLHSRLIMPVDFDSTKQYPVILYVYNGPHVQLVQNQWMGGQAGRWLFLMHHLSSLGYAVYTLDGRGSANRGLTFEQKVFRQLGSQEMEDQLVGIKYLSQKPWVDTTRMGVLGWSYGGFMTTSLMLRKPGVFKVGVAGGPVIDWSLYEVMYTERYMDTPEANPEGYKQSNLTQYVTNLEGDLLVIQGMQDDVVVPQHAQSLLRKAVQENVQIDFYPYSIYPHHVRGPDQLHLLQMIVDYFQDHL